MQQNDRAYSHSPWTANPPAKKDNSSREQSRGFEKEDMRRDMEMWGGGGARSSRTIFKMHLLPLMSIPFVCMMQIIAAEKVHIITPEDGEVVRALPIVLMFQVFSPKHNVKIFLDGQLQVEYPRFTEWRVMVIPLGRNEDGALITNGTHTVGMRAGSWHEQVRFDLALPAPDQQQGEAVFGISTVLFVGDFRGRGLERRSERFARGLEEAGVGVYRLQEVINSLPECFFTLPFMSDSNSHASTLMSGSASQCTALDTGEFGGTRMKSPRTLSQKAFLSTTLVKSAICLGRCYAMPGTNIAYGATTRTFPLPPSAWSYRRGAEPWYNPLWTYARATRSPVLTYAYGGTRIRSTCVCVLRGHVPPIVLSGVGPDIAYAATWRRVFLA